MQKSKSSKTMNTLTIGGRAITLRSTIFWLGAIIATGGTVGICAFSHSGTDASTLMALSIGAFCIGTILSFTIACIGDWEKKVHGKNTKDTPATVAA